MTSASEGTCDIGMASRDLTDEEKQNLTPHRNRSGRHRSHRQSEQRH